MRSSVLCLATFFCGVLVSSAINRYAIFRSAPIPVHLIPKDEALKSGDFRFKTDYECLLPLHVGAIIEKCQIDIDAFDGGKSRLVSVYRSKNHSRLIVLFEIYSDGHGHAVSDKTVAYVYDNVAGSLIGKFWAPI